jgi:hypothetical protein
MDRLELDGHCAGEFDEQSDYFFGSDGWQRGVLPRSR